MIGIHSFLGGWTSGDAPPVVPPVVDTEIHGGVKKKRPVIRLSDYEDRQSLADFIKENIRTREIAVGDEIKLPVIYKSGKKSKRQIADERNAEVAMRNMQIEAENESRIIRNNNAIILAAITAVINEQ